MAPGAAGKVLPLDEHQPLAGLPGIGPATRECLQRIGLQRVGDLWFHLPLRYEDRTRITPIADLRDGVEAQIEGEVLDCDQRRHFVALLADASGRAQLRLVHVRPGQTRAIRPGVRLRLFGTPRRLGLYPEFVHPKIQVLAMTHAAPVEEALTPVYPSTEGLAQAKLRQIIGRSLTRLPADAELELLPAGVLAGLGLPSLRTALLGVHAPDPSWSAESLEARQTPAQRRLAFEELLAHQLAMRRRRAEIRSQRAPVLPVSRTLLPQLLARLPFAPTAAQQRVFREIAADLAATVPMLRLVQGDVGAGKTLVAAMAALNAIEAGWQVALVAPTELLAEQHCKTFRRWLAPLGVTLVWLSGSLSGKRRSEALAALAGGAGMAIGTHALLQENVRFQRLGLVLIDEQHRFGVAQRLSLARREAGEGDLRPHQLVLSATPIPRTLAMASHADLDLSLLDELPPGRTPVRTVLVSASRRDEVIERVRHALGEGRQAYWVNTLIDENPELSAEAAAKTAADLTRALPGFAVGLVHGRLRPADRDQVMSRFAAGEIRLLVATTVIEVGVDVPNASLMLIENAERLGLSQLHQLRGRVGRGSAASSCVLIYQPPIGEPARTRLSVLRDCHDGFRIAEEDLRLRGPGELLGTRQAGLPAFRVARLLEDAALLPEVRRAADTLLASPERCTALIRRWIGDKALYAQA